MTINWIELLIELVLFLIASYFIFYKAWLIQLGKQLAKLVTIEKLTVLEQNVKKDFNEKIESYKNELNKELSLTIEPIKSELAKNNITHQIEFGFLHKKRAESILELYAKLQELHSAMVSWTAPLQPIIEDAEKERNQRTDRVNDGMIDFKNYYILNKILFPLDICNSIDSLFEKYWKKGWDYGFKQNRLSSSSLVDVYIKQYIDEMSEISKEVREEFPKMIEIIEEQFRGLLKTEKDL